MKEWLIKMPTSKKLTWVYTLFFIAQVGVTMYIRTKYATDLSNLLVYTAPLQSVVFGGYFYKAYQEKLNLPDNNTSDTLIQTGTTDSQQ